MSDNANIQFELHGSALHRFDRDAMACTFELYLCHDDAKYAEHVARACFDEIGRIEQTLSRFIPTSEVAQLNAAAVDTPVPIGEDTLTCLQLAATLYDETDGAFDVTYRRPRDGGAGPPLVVDPAQHVAGVLVPGVTVDLGGIGKGYALDRVIEIVREWGIEAALVHSGRSTVFAVGEWPVQLRDPTAADRMLGRLKLVDAALAGSGQRLHGQHIVDPRSGVAVPEERVVWAIADSAAVADALSTAFMVMSTDEIDALCGRRKDVTAILRRAETAGAVRVIGRSIDMGA